MALICKQIRKKLIDNELNIFNNFLILKLLDERKLDLLVNKVDLDISVNIMDYCIYKKEFLSGLDLFLINFDYFISYVNNYLFLGSYHYAFLDLILKITNLDILLYKDYIHKNTEIQKDYNNELNKVIVERFIKNMRFMYQSVKLYLEYFNIFYDDLKVTRPFMVKKVMELLNALIISNYSDLVSLLSVLFSEKLEEVVTSGKKIEETVFHVLWINAFEELMIKKIYIKKLYEFDYLFDYKKDDC